MSRLRIEESSDPREVPRRIAVIRREESARISDEPSELVTTAPHLLLRELMLVQLTIVALALASLAVDAPLEGIADPLHTPNPAKAPWYFLGLQELLHYFPPIVAGVLLPTLVVIALVVVPFFRVNVELVGFHERPGKRRLWGVSALTAIVSAVLVAFHVWPVLAPTMIVYGLLLAPALPVLPAGLRRRLARVPLADWIMTWFVAVAVVLTLIGVLFRGPSWAWSWPWREGIF